VLLSQKKFLEENGLHLADEDVEDESQLSIEDGKFMAVIFEGTGANSILLRFFVT
jgi:hypothetical protein